MAVIEEVDVKKDSRNRITLPAGLSAEHWRLRRFADGHIELQPMLLVEATVSENTLRDIDSAMRNLGKGKTGKPLDIAALNRLAGDLEAIDDAPSTRRTKHRKS